MLVVEYKSKPFIGVLAAYLVFNVVVGTIFLLDGELISILSIGLAATILLFMYRRAEYLILSIKIWAALSLLGGLAGLISNGCAYVHVAAGGTQLTAESYSIGTVMMNLLFIGVGFYYFLYADEYIIKQT